MLVHGVGPSPCDIAIIGEGPGWEEDREGRPFVGKTGDEIDLHLESNQLPDRRHIFLTNIYRQYGGKDYKWTAEDLERDEPDLLRELSKVRPSTIVTLGRYATRWILGDVDMDGTHSLPWKVEVCYGCMGNGRKVLVEGQQDRQSCSFCNKTLTQIICLPVFHPAAGLHNPELSPFVVSGFKALSEYLDGRLEPRALFNDPIKETVYEEITSEAHLNAVTSHWTHSTKVSVDTEGWPWLPWSLQFSDEPGKAYLIRKGAPDLLRGFSRRATGRGVRLVYHSALHDLGMARALDIPKLTSLPFDDTMVMAYLLQIEPQGLKAGCLRHCNMKMSEYMDIVGDRANELARSYLTWLWDLETVEHGERCEQEFWRRKTEIWVDAKGKTQFGRRITKIPELPKTPLLKAVTRVLGSKRPHDLWEDQVEDLQVAAYNRLGPMPVATLDYVPQATAIAYGCRDADGTTRLLPEYERRIDSMGLRGVYNLELATYPLLDRMQQIGIKPDLEHFTTLSSVLGQEIETLKERLVAKTGRDQFNANSGDQVADYLFGDLGLEEVKFTSGGRGSTNDKILEALEHEHPEYPVLSDLREYRALYKLKNTFVDRLPDYVNRWPYDGRVHTTLRTTRVVTGRLAAADPNMLAQPEYGTFAKDFQRGWVADDEHSFWVGDESQIELRGLAHLSQDPVLLAIYRGELRNPDGSFIDIHARTAHKIFGGNINEYLGKGPCRLAAKAVNFGIPMGMTCRGLSVELRKNGVDADEETAQRWLDETLSLYQGVKRYMVERIEEANRNGYVRCLSGRIRYIGGIRSRNSRVREEAQRFAFSTPIQESAQFIMKQAEARVWNEVLPYFWKRRIWCEPLLQVHDSLKMEVQKGYERELHLHMKDAMTNVPQGFDVPLEIEGESGPTFADCVKFREEN